MNGNYYIELCKEIKKEIPNIHIHGFSPEEVLYGSIRSKTTIQDYLIELGAVKSTIKRLRVEKNEQDELEESFIAYELFMRCMHPNGIAYDVIKKKIPVINQEIAKILANIVEKNYEFDLSLTNKKTEYTSGTLWKYSQSVGPAYKGAVTHPGASKERKCYADI